MFPTYNSPYMGQAPYMMQQNQYQQAQQIPYAPQNQNNVQSMSGKFVNDFSEVTANDVPMNGSYAVFVKSDGSEVQLRKWNNMGMIDTTLYKPHFEPKQEQAVNLSPEQAQNEIRAFGERLGGIETALAELSDKLDRYGKQSTSKTVKKEVANEQ